MWKKWKYSPKEQIRQKLNVSLQNQVMPWDWMKSDIASSINEKTIGDCGKVEAYGFGDGED